MHGMLYKKTYTQHSTFLSRSLRVSIYVSTKEELLQYGQKLEVKRWQLKSFAPSSIRQGNKFLEFNLAFVKYYQLRSYFLIAKAKVIIMLIV